jgi:hypothetical protein
MQSTVPRLPGQLAHFLIELPLVVAKLLRWWRQRILGFCLLRLVLCHSVTHPGLHIQHPLLQL